jgi:hypothetical protein
MLRSPARDFDPVAYSFETCSGATLPHRDPEQFVEHGGVLCSRSLWSARVKSGKAQSGLGPSGGLTGPPRLFEKKYRERNLIPSRNPALKDEVKKHFCIQDNCNAEIHRGAFYGGFYDRLRPFQADPRNSVKGIQKQQIHCKRSR